MSQGEKPTMAPTTDSSAPRRRCAQPMAGPRARSAMTQTNRVLAIPWEGNTPEEKHQADKRRADDGERDPDGGHRGAEQRNERDQDVRIERSEIASVALHQGDVAMKDVDSGDGLNGLIGVERDLTANDQADDERERDDQTESPDGEPFRRGPFSHCPRG